VNKPSFKAPPSAFADGGAAVSPTLFKASFGNHRQPEIWSRAFEIARFFRTLLAVSALLHVVTIGLAIALAFRPADVIFIDKVGNATFIPKAESAPSPVDYEAEAFSQTWARDFLSLDAVTAQDDFARALSVMHPELQTKLRAEFVDSGMLDKIRNAFVRSAVKIEKTEVTSKSTDRFSVTIGGTRTLMAMGSSGRTLNERFQLELVLAVVPRSRRTPNGLLVRHLGGHINDKALATEPPSQTGEAPK
jgi:hypothetical protein